jgi:hypothetical protein
VRNQNLLVRRGVLCSLALGAHLFGIRPAAAEIPLVEEDGWTFFTDGRVNVFLSQGIGDGVPPPSPNPNIGPDGMPGPSHNILGGDGSLTSAGYVSGQADVNGKYNAARIRNGFLASILAFGMRRKLSESTSIKAYISLWGTAETYGRDRTQDTGFYTSSKGFDVR